MTMINKRCYDINKVVEEIVPLLIDKYGQDAQIGVAIEEMAELTQALSKYQRGKPDMDNIEEEIADVIFCTLQLTKIFNINIDTIYHNIMYKTNRTVKRIEEEK